MATDLGIATHDVIVDGLRIHYVQAGSGSPVVLVHGIAASAVDWHLNVAALAQHFTVTAMDLPGFGESEIPTTPMAMIDAVRFLDGFLPALKIEAAALIGNSMGGLICAHYAIARPNRVRSLVLVDPAGMARDLSIHFRLLTIPALGRRFLKPNPNAGALAARGLFADPTRAPAIWMADKVRDRGPQAQRHMLHALRSGASIFGLRRELIMLDRLRLLDIPSLVMWGAHDHVVPAWHLQLVRQRFPSAQTYLFADAGHVPMLECPEEFNRVAIDFLLGAGG